MRGIAKRALQRESTALGPVCPHCPRPQLPLPQHRRFASSAPPRPPPAGLAALPSRQLLSVTGPEAARFLQGIITANVTGSDGLPRTDAFYSGFLSATGRVMHDIFVYPFPGGRPAPFPVPEAGYLVEADASEMARLARHVKRYKLRAKVTVRAVTPDEASVWHAWDDSPRPDTAPSGLDMAPRDGAAPRLVLRDPRAPGMGHRIIQTGGRAPEVDLEPATEAAYTVRRYLGGVPEGQDEILRDHALPLETNMDVMRGIDFHKGCYVGQELTIRTKHRGVVRKRILPCCVYDVGRAPPRTLTYEPGGVDGPEALTADMIPCETSIGRVGKRGRGAGKWVKGVGNIGLALCRLDVMTDVLLPGEQAAATFRPEDEFVLEWGDEDNKSCVRVKAFVPEWLRGGLGG